MRLLGARLVERENEADPRTRALPGGPISGLFHRNLRLQRIGAIFPLELVTSPSGWHGATEQETSMSERFERHRQPWRTDEIQKLHTLARKGMSLRAIAKALTRSEESVKERAKLDGLSIAKLH